MPSDFDISAKNYDEVFTFSEIGRAQRNRVYRYINKHISEETLSILEINCGTGEDASYLSKKGHQVLATDISGKMIARAREKHTNVRFQQLDITQINQNTFSESFDLIFSNFGGINCLSKAQLTAFVKISETLLKPKGKMMLVIMPKKCLWERFYFLMKGDPKKSHRRNTNNSTPANVDGVQVATWYFNPKEVVTLAKDHLNTLEIRPIGIAIPPSYLESYFRKKRWLLKVLTQIETWFTASFWAPYADHYLIVFQKK